MDGDTITVCKAIIIIRPLMEAETAAPYVLHGAIAHRSNFWDKPWVTMHMMA